MNTERFTAALSKRDYFAGQAMMGLLEGFPGLTAQQIAERAVERADALLAELAKTEPKEEAKPEADAEGWIPWNGGECPVKGNKLVSVRLRNWDVLSNHRPEHLWWGRDEKMSDIEILFWKPA